jgi:hypothetical protein
MQYKNVVEVGEDCNTPNPPSYYHTLVHNRCESLRSGRYPERHSHVSVISVAATEAKVEGEEVVDPNVVISVLYVQLAGE